MACYVLIRKLGVRQSRKDRLFLFPQVAIETFIHESIRGRRLGGTRISRQDFCEMKNTYYRYRRNKNETHNEKRGEFFCDVHIIL